MTKKKATERTAAAPADYLKKPYGRVVFPEADGTFRAEIIEFPGCIAVGDTAGEAQNALERVAFSWLEAAIERGQQIPPPIDGADFSGKLVVRMPRSIHKRAAHLAARESVSLNQLIVSCIAERVGAASQPFIIAPTHQTCLTLQMTTTPTLTLPHLSYETGDLIQHSTTSAGPRVIFPMRDKAHA